ncbi:putative SOS response-associated peptidase YedK [Larkinella arboricola]|uniref:Abasic site processing protein n=1 Tax=Larkinella arboricola TaxID=643671 RepID=A0A327X1Q2_LARAB|nr:SOS response-associated peptidase [Larkinella arboricola]RAK00451.1 putative SOS response-associated peptidase YedK [Larkinella arboricola]
MCYSVKIISELGQLAKTFKVSNKAPENEDYNPSEKISGFAHPLLPVISQENPGEIQLFKWGLIPSWAKEDKADELANMTLNAREESIFEKPSFKDSIGSRRCLLLVDGFYEWRHEKKEKIPYFITMADGKPFALGCIYSVWKGQPTFSIVTTRANPLMEYIHNTKKRMPLMLSHQEERRWINPELSKTEIQELMQPLDESEMKAEILA